MPFVKFTSGGRRAIPPEVMIRKTHKLSHNPAGMPAIFNLQTPTIQPPMCQFVGLNAFF